MEHLLPYERGAYLAFHRLAYAEDLELSRALLARSPRWSIITGYYAMHSLAKLYLAEAHNIKVTGDHEGSHIRVVEALQKVLTDTRESDRVMALLSDAEEAFIGMSHPRQIPGLLEAGRVERKRAQYYTRPGSSAVVEKRKAQEFGDRIVSVFVRLMEVMRSAS